jgi:alkylhydroperoxidase family enzyme
MRKLTLTPDEVSHVDVERVRESGVSEEAIRDAIAVCATFNIIDRIADSLDFRVPTREEFDAGAEMLYNAGYAMVR